MTYVETLEVSSVLFFLWVVGSFIELQVKISKNKLRYNIIYIEYIIYSLYHIFIIWIHHCIIYECILYEIFIVYMIYIHILYNDVFILLYIYVIYNVYYIYHIYNECMIYDKVHHTLSYLRIVTQNKWGVIQKLEVI